MLLQGKFHRQFSAIFNAKKKKSRENRQFSAIFEREKRHSKENFMKLRSNFLEFSA
jgi:hypothetical protein